MYLIQKICRSTLDLVIVKLVANVEDSIFNSTYIAERERGSNTGDPVKVYARVSGTSKRSLVGEAEDHHYASSARLQGCRKILILLRSVSGLCCHREVQG